MAHRPSKETQEPQEPLTIRPLTRALVVGGHGPFVEDRLRENLKKHGIHIVHHWDYALRRPPDLPADIDVMYICTDCVSHPLSAAAISAAKKRGLRILNGGRKWASTAQYLRLAGFPDKTPAALSVDSIPENIPATLDAPTQTKEQMKPTSFPEPAVADDIIPYVRLLCEKPDTTNADMFARLLKETPGFRFNDRCASKARVFLGIRTGFSSKRGIFTEVADPMRLQDIALSIGAVPKPAPPVPEPVPVQAAPPVPAPVPEEVVIVKPSRVRPATPKKEKVTMPVTSVTKTPVTVKPASPAPAPAAAPAPAPAPTPVQQETRPEVNVAPVKLTMKALIDELRAKMLIFDIEEITITQTTAPAKLRATVDLG